MPQLLKVCHVSLIVMGMSLACVQQIRAENTNNSLFEVPLNKKSLELLAEVERLYGKAIRTELLPVDDPMAGRSMVSDDGTPVVKINPKLGRHLDVIVHELYHFVIQSRGYPVILWQYPKLMDTAENRRAFKELGFQIWDPILHLVFYSEARARLGIDPGYTTEQLNRKAIEDGSARTKLTHMDARGIALAYYRLRMESSDQTVIQQFMVLLQEQGKKDQVAVGEQLVAIVERAKPLSPTTAVGALVECMNLFYGGQYAFVQRPWTKRQLGIHTQIVAPVELRFVRAPTFPLIQQ